MIYASTDSFIPSFNESSCHWFIPLFINLKVDDLPSVLFPSLQQTGKSLFNLTHPVYIIPMCSFIHQLTKCLSLYFQANKLFNVLSFVCLSIIYPLILSCFDSLIHSHIHYSSIPTSFLLSVLPFLPPNRHSFVHLLIHDKLISVACVPVPPSFPFFQYISHLFIHPSIYFTLTGGWFSGSPAALDLSLQTQGRCWPMLEIGRAAEKLNCRNHVCLALICMFDILSQRLDNQSVGRAEPLTVKTRCLARAMLNTQHLGLQ